MRDLREAWAICPGCGRAIGLHVRDVDDFWRALGLHARVGCTGRP